MIFQKNQASDEIIELIKYYGGDISDKKIIQDAIKDSYSDRSNTHKLWKEYDGEVPIKNRTMPETYMPNSKLTHPFRNMIVNTKNNIYLSNPIQYSYDTKKYTDVEQTAINREFELLQTRNDIENLDYELGQYIGACGHAFRLLYHNPNGDVMLYNILPWEAYIEIDNDTMKTQYGLIFYKKARIRSRSHEVIFRWCVEYYDDVNISIYNESDDGTDYILEETRPHGFNKVPIVKFKNVSSKSDFEFVRTLINDYDYRASDSSNILRNASNPIRVIKTNKSSDKLNLKMFGQARTVVIGPDDEFRYEIPNISSEYKEVHLDRLRKDIYSLSNTLDLSNLESVQNAESGYARTIRMFNMLNDVRGKERNFSKGLKELFDIMLPTMKNINLKPEDVYFVYVENVPSYFSSDDAVKFVASGILSRKTIMEKLGVEDVEKELLELKKERLENNNIFNLDMIKEPEPETTGSAE